MLTFLAARTWNFALSQHAIQLLEVRGFGALVGLLNHQSMALNEGLLFRKNKIFHTVGMRIPISILGVDKHGCAIGHPVLVCPNCVVVAPLRARYVVELHAAWAESENKMCPKNKGVWQWQLPEKILGAFLFGCRMGKIAFLLAVAAFIGFQTARAFAVTRDKLELTSGEVHEVSFARPPAKIELSDERVIAVERVGTSNSLKIKAKSVGKSSLQVRYPDGTSQIYDVAVTNVVASTGTVRNSSPLDAAAAVAQLKRTMGLVGRLQGDKLYVDGEIKRLEDFRTLVSIAASSPDALVSQFHFHSSASAICLRSLEDDLRLLGAPELRVSQRDGTFFLLGSAPDAEVGRRAFSFARQVLPNLIDGRDADAGSSDEVMIELRFLEVSRAEGTEVGIGVTANRGPVNFNSAVGSEGNSLSLKVAPVDIMLRALGRREFSRELARPLLRTRDGRTAMFLAGGEIPVTTTSTEGENKRTLVEYKPYGVQLSMTPSLRRTGLIWIDLKAESSQVASAKDVSGIPSFLTRRLETSLSLEEGQTALLGGLTEDKDSKSIERVPFLADIPILGELFKSRKFRGAQSELWVLLTAERNPSHAERVRKAEDTWKAMQLLLPASIRD